MCMTPNISTPKPIIPESVKRVASDQRRIVADNTAAANAAAGANQKTGSALGLKNVPASTDKKSLLGA